MHILLCSFLQKAISILATPIFTRLLSTKFIVGAGVVSALLNIVLNPLFGYYAAGYTTLVCYIVYAAAHYFCMWRICKANGHNENYYNPGILLVIYTGLIFCGFLLSSLYTYPNYMLWFNFDRFYNLAVILQLLRDVFLLQTQSTWLEMSSYFFVNTMMTIFTVSFLATSSTKPLSLMINQFEAQTMLEAMAFVSLLIWAVNLTAKGIAALEVRGRGKKHADEKPV